MPAAKAAIEIISLSADVLLASIDTSATNGIAPPFDLSEYKRSLTVAAGAYTGAKFVAPVGAAFGSAGGPGGTAVGGVVGAAVGGWIGSSIAQAAYDKHNGDIDLALAEIEIGVAALAADAEVMMTSAMDSALSVLSIDASASEQAAAVNNSIEETLTGLRGVVADYAEANGMDRSQIELAPVDVSAFEKSITGVSVDGNGVLDSIEFDVAAAAGSEAFGTKSALSKGVLYGAKKTIVRPVLPRFGIWSVPWRRSHLLRQVRWISIPQFVTTQMLGRPCRLGVCHETRLRVRVVCLVVPKTWHTLEYSEFDKTS